MTARVARAADMARGCPPKVLPWSPGTKAAATSARAQHAPTGMPLPRALAMVTTSGSMPEVLEAEPASGPAQAGLDLVHHEQDVPVGAELAQPGQVVRRRHDDPGLAHDGLDQDGGHPGRVAGRLHGVEVVVGDVVEPVGHGEERRLLLGLPGGGQGGQGPAVEGVPRAHHA